MRLRDRFLDVRASSDAWRRYRIQTAQSARLRPMSRQIEFAAVADGHPTPEAGKPLSVAPAARSLIDEAGREHRRLRMRRSRAAITIDLLEVRELRGVEIGEGEFRLGVPRSRMSSVDPPWPRVFDSIWCADQ